MEGAGGSDSAPPFPEPRLCKAVVDRLTFNAHILETGTESWRFRSSVKRQKGARKT